MRSPEHVWQNGWMSFVFLVQPDLDDARSAEVPAVRDLATVLHEEMRAARVVAALAAIPEIRGTSHAVDAILTPIATRLGFESQKKDLFSTYPTRLRPDWYRPLGKQGSGGILLEVERGKALANNMDLLDLWKCHICREAHHLFLVVPLQVKRTRTVEIVYDRVVKRMQTFVEPGNKVNVATISVFGYGASAGGPRGARRAGGRSPRRARSAAQRR